MCGTVHPPSSGLTVRSALTGFVILAVLLTLVILCFSWDFLFDLWWAYRSYIFTWCIAYLIQSVLMRMVFMKRVLSHNGKVEKYVVGFSAMAYLDSVIALITSLTAGVFRLLYVFGFSAVWFVRLDYSMFPKVLVLPPCVPPRGGSEGRGRMTGGWRWSACPVGGGSVRGKLYNYTIWNFCNSNSVPNFCTQICFGVFKDLCRYT